MGGRNADLNLIIAAMPSNEISIAGAAMPNKLDSLGTRLGAKPSLVIIVLWYDISRPLWIPDLVRLETDLMSHI